MIFIGLFLFIAFIIIALNMYNQSNLNEIEKYLEQNKCMKYVYSKGSYKALCEDYFIEIKNSFNLNINENSNIFNYKDLKKVEIKNLDILINENHKIAFKEKKDLEQFYEELNSKLEN